jgi:hypothetical protein
MAIQSVDSIWSSVMPGSTAGDFLAVAPRRGLVLLLTA